MYTRVQRIVLCARHITDVSLCSNLLTVAANPLLHLWPEVADQALHTAPDGTLSQPTPQHDAHNELSQAAHMSEERHKGATYVPVNNRQ